MKTFEEILQQKILQHQNIIFDVVQTIEILQNGHSGGLAKPFFENSKLKSVHILIDKKLDEMIKIKILFHELGHAIDYFNRSKELENVEITGRNKEEFCAKSEFFAFQNSLKEGLVLYKNGRKDVLESLVETIPKRKSEKGYSYGVIEIEKTDLWKLCNNTVNLK